MNIPLLNDIVIIFGLSIAVLFICHRLRIPAIVGFLLTGVLAGPHGFRLIHAVHEVEILAEIGVILLLFTIGIEFSLKNLLRIKKSVIIGGSFQVVLTILAVYGITRITGQGFGQSVFMGFLICLSSTAIVLRLMQERAEVDTPHGSTCLGILIFQDIVVVPMILITPVLAGSQGSSNPSFYILIAKAAGIVVLVIVGARWVIPYVLYQIARTRSRELFLLSIVALCLAIAWLTASAGLSLALGAFLAGLIISESEYSHQALSNILPFRDVFTSFFFVSIGMLLNMKFVFQHWQVVLLITLGILVLKALIAAGAAMTLGFPIRTAALVGLTLSQVGEFSFILSKTGMTSGLLDTDNYQMFLAFSVLTMAVAPFIIAAGPRMADIITRLPFPSRLKNGAYSVSNGMVSDKTQHLIIIGFGITGKHLARVAKVVNIPYVIIEMNTETVRKEKAKGEPIHYGDATQDAVFHHANIKAAKMIAVAINDPVAARRITEIARELNPRVHLIVRTRYFQEMSQLYRLGADDVIPEEFETSVEIFTRVLRKYLIPADEIEKLAADIRADGYEMFRDFSDRQADLCDLSLHIPNVEIISLRVAENAYIAEKTLADTRIREKYAVTVLAVRRADQVIPNPDGAVRLKANDIAVILGLPENISQVSELFQYSP